MFLSTTVLVWQDSGYVVERKRRRGKMAYISLPIIVGLGEISFWAKSLTGMQSPMQYILICYARQVLHCMRELLKVGGKD